MQKWKHDKAWEPCFLVSLLGGKDKENLEKNDSIFFPAAIGTLYFALKRNATEGIYLRGEKEVFFVTFTGS